MPHEKICPGCNSVFLAEKKRNICCSRKCSGILKSIRYLGRNNPNCKYKGIDDSLMKSIDSEEKAYFLGWVASDGHLSKTSNATVITLKLSDYEILENIRDLLFPGLEVKKNPITNRCKLQISSKEIRDDICHHLGIPPGKKAFTVNFPEILKDNKPLALAFIRGLFDGDGTIRKTGTGRSGIFPYPECSIASSSESMRDSVYEIIGLPGSRSKYGLTWCGSNCLDFLSLIYDAASIKLDRKYKLYLDWCIWTPGLLGTGTYGSDLSGMRWNKTHKDAQPPFKARASDSGFDLTLISVYKETKHWIMYDTGIKVQPPFGFYFDLVPRSSLFKKGYTLANNVGIIDRSYTGNVLVPLLKFNQEMPDLELPFRGVQLIPRRAIHFEIVEVDELDETVRGEGGFGSTGNN